MARSTNPETGRRVQFVLGLVISFLSIVLYFLVGLTFSVGICLLIGLPMLFTSLGSNPKESASGISEAKKSLLESYWRKRALMVLLPLAAVGALGAVLIGSGVITQVPIFPFIVAIAIVTLIAFSWVRSDYEKKVRELKGEDTH